ncbi:MAG TPA: GGDEF domain-containing protein [Dermatophilaceae bacterium]|nr:GGDEF domain-containing protein [Dermatophilaceae bacterium]
MQDRDPLTGLPARAACLAEISRSIATGEAFTLLLVDLDALKVVNGFNSHRRGDWLLQRVGQATGALDPLATVFRFGGDEFVVLLPTSDIREATQFGQRIRAAVSSIDLLESGEPVEPDDPAPWCLDCSIGIARWPEDAGTAGDLVAAADRALYVAKRDGGGRVATTTDVPRDLPGSAGLRDA